MGTVREVSEMSRYIEADAVITAIAEFNKYEDELEYPYASDDLEEYKDDARLLIEDAPSIDIVRCKECKHWIGETEHYEDREYKACWQLCGQYMNSEFWCKYGEREGE